AGQRSAEDPFAQVRIAEAAALIDSAWLALERDMTELMGHATSNEKIPLPLRLRTRRDQVTGTGQAIRAVDLLFEHSRGRALEVGTPSQRLWRGGAEDGHPDPAVLAGRARGPGARDQRPGTGAVHVRPRRARPRRAPGRDVLTGGATTCTFTTTKQARDRRSSCCTAAAPARPGCPTSSTTCPPSPNTSAPS